MRKTFFNYRHFSSLFLRKSDFSNDKRYLHLALQLLTVGRTSSRMSRKRRLFGLLTFVYGLVCAIGCYIQINSITASYFEYQITTQVKVELPTTLLLPSLNVCFRIVDLFNFPLYVNQSNVNVSQITGSKGPSAPDLPIDALMSMITIHDVFKYTPGNTKNLLSCCIYRRPNSYNFHDLRDSNACHEMFSVANFYLQEFICYRVELSKYVNQEYHYRSVAFALTHPGLLYSVSFNISPHFESVQSLKIIVNEQHERPFRSAAFTPSVGRFFDNRTKLSRYNWFTTTFYILTNELMPPPYQTKCLDYSTLGFIDHEDCTKKCLIKECLRAFQRYPYSVYEKEALNEKIITLSQLHANASMSKMLYRFERKCAKQCNRKGCAISYTVTHVTKDPNNDFMTFNVLIPQFPNYFIKFHPKLSFIEYFIYVLSCFGTWFGLSILSLNPCNYKEWLDKILHHQHPENNQESNDGPTRTRKGVLGRVNAMNDRTCLYCSQTRIIVLSDLKQRLSLLEYLMSQYRHKNKSNLNPALI